MPAPVTHQFRKVILPGKEYKFRLTGDNISSPLNVLINEMNTAFQWTVHRWEYDKAKLTLTVFATAKAVKDGLPDGVPTGDGSMLIVITNPPDSLPGPAQPDMSPPFIAAYYSDAE